MADLNVTSLTIEELLNHLRGREWQIPQFQREFVWSVGQVIELIQSILLARPIGMATIWEQPDETSLELGPLSLPDTDPITNDESQAVFSAVEEDPKKVFAVLDGLQRCTAIALAFGGFRTHHKDYRTSGRYFLNVAASDPLEKILFVKERDVLEKQYDHDATCISQGLFPLSSNNAGEGIFSQWLRYNQSIRDAQFYKDSILPLADELDRRDRVLKQAFEGIYRTKLAVYIVPDTFSLADICDIFQKLNLTGTKVSTVDLIHSWLYGDTAKDLAGPIRLREWVDDFGQRDGAIGWSASDDRPELPIQMATACHVAMEVKAQPRKIKRGTIAAITSVKSEDLLSTPPEHWKLITEKSKSEKLAEYLKDFQLVVASGLFPHTWCPYPVSFAIYVALRFHAFMDKPAIHPWSTDDLNVLFKAFFWRNALTNRYDQGFLTQLGVDINKLKEFLKKRREFKTAGKWASAIEPELSKLIDKPLPSKEDLFEYVTDGRPGGAMQRALYLPMLASASKDLLDPIINLKYTESNSELQLHHIYPRDWCRNNITGELAKVLDIKKAGRDWVNSVSNLMPLSRSSNNVWKANIPGQVLVRTEIDFIHHSEILKNAFIDEYCFDCLMKGPDGIKNFWEHRANLLVEDLLNRMNIII